MIEVKLPKELPVSTTEKLYVTTREGWASADSSLSNQEYNQRLIQRVADQCFYDAALAEVAKLEELLQLAHDNMDYLNGVLGTEERLCVFCGSKEADGGGIVHSKDCLIIKMRQSLRRGG